MLLTNDPKTSQAVPAPLAHDRVRDLAQVGLMAARRCDIDTAEIIFSAIERSHPHRSMAYAGEVMARLAVGRLQDALLAADRGLRLTQPEDHAELHTLRGLALRAAGRQRESDEALLRAGDYPLAQAMLADKTFDPTATNAIWNLRSR